MVFPIRSLLRRTLTQLVLRSSVRDTAWQRQCFKRFSCRTDADSLALDIGSGSHPRNPFACSRAFGLDVRPSQAVIQCDLSVAPIPFPDASVAVVTAFDFLEHVPRVLSVVKPDSADTTRFPFLELMNEVHRVLKPGGLFFSSTPCYPWPMAFSDPTHVNIMTEETITHYFCQPKLWARMYGFSGDFIFLDGGWIDCHYNALIQKAV